MNLDHLQKKLLVAAKDSPPTDRVPLAFEKRVLAQLSAKPALDLVTLWSRALWRATVPCLALMVVLIGIALYPTGNTSSTAVATSTTSSDDLNTVFEQTLLASTDQFATIDFLEEN